MQEKLKNFLIWCPRILTILLILFLSLFSLDVFGSGYGFLEIILGLFMHNIPGIIFTIILIISWKHELLGAVVFGILGIILTLWSSIIYIITKSSNTDPSLSPIGRIFGVPMLLIGILFYINRVKKRNRVNNSR